MNTELEQKTCLTHELLARAHTHTTKRRANKKKCHPLSNDALIESRSAPPSRSLAHSLTQRTTLTRNQPRRKKNRKHSLILTRAHAAIALTPAQTRNEKFTPKR
uniref:(northern house mosquito) hypothetical protein n=1 Tax=Culex pipiens TaxID=7175 RepID=A0A8D8F4F2_CULPI